MLKNINDKTTKTDIRRGDENLTLNEMMDSELTEIISKYTDRDTPKEKRDDYYDNAHSDFY